VEGEGVSAWEVVAVFVGIPVLVLLLIALPIFGSVWWKLLRSWGGRAAGAAEGDDVADQAVENPGTSADPAQCRGEHPTAPEPPRA
jgi:hypothetical protein